MSNITEEKWPKSLVGCIIFLFILVLLIATIVPNSLIEKAMVTEERMGQSLLTESDMQQVTDRTKHIYELWMIHSGLKARVSDIFMPRGPTTVNALEEKATVWFSYLAKRGEALQRIGYQMTYRLVLMMYWIPLFIVVAIPSVIAGVMRWQAKRHGFEYSSPFINNNSVGILVWGVILTLVSLLLPAPLPPLIICTVLIAVMPIVFSLMISNMPKRI